MIKAFGILLLATMNVFAFKPTKVSVENARQVFANVNKHEAAGEEFLKLTSNEDLTPLMKGYRGAIMMMMAEHKFSPVSKWNYFSEGRDLLEEAIGSEPQTVELIYLRFCIQTNAPAFLGYNHHIRRDKLFLTRALLTLQDPVLKKMIQSYLDRPQIKNS